MLQVGQIYKDRNGREILIGGRIKEYSEFRPFVWSVGGDWYDEQTGRFVFSSRNGGHYLAITPTWRCLIIPKKGKHS
jgi:hypothetical protein